MQSFNIQDCILYEDKDILVCHKPAGVAVQSARFGMADMDPEIPAFDIFVPKVADFTDA